MAVTPTRLGHAESRCKAAIEPIVFGIPVIAPDFGPFPYLIENESNGLLYAPDSVPELRDCLVRVLRDDALHQRLAEGARSTGNGLLESPLTFTQAITLAFGPVH